MEAIKVISGTCVLGFFIGLLSAFVYYPLPLTSPIDVGALLVGSGFVGSTIVFAGALVAGRLEKK